MSHSNMTNVKISCISQLRSDIQSILNNINELEDAVHDTGSSAAHVDRLKKETDEILKILEDAPLERFAKKIKKRKQLRKLKNMRLKEIKTFLKHINTFQESTVTRKIQSTDRSSLSTAIAKESASCHARAIKTKLHNRLLKHHDAQRFLRTFELLKMLHFSRSQNSNSTREFAAQLSDLRATWIKVLEDNAPESRRDQHVEDQWNEVFFGPAEHSYYGGESKTSDFLRIRRIWDSYLTRSKQGSSIPCGWVLPHENATADWQQYKDTR